MGKNSSFLPFDLVAKVYIFFKLLIMVTNHGNINKEQKFIFGLWQEPNTFTQHLFLAKAQYITIWCEIT